MGSYTLCVVPDGSHFKGDQKQLPSTRRSSGLLQRVGSCFGRKCCLSEHTASSYSFQQLLEPNSVSSNTEALVPSKRRNLELILLHATQLDNIYRHSSIQGIHTCGASAKFNLFLGMWPKIAATGQRGYQRACA